MWYWLAAVVTFPEGLIWPGLRHSWYAAVCAAWLPIGAVWFVRDWRETNWRW